MNRKRDDRLDAIRSIVRNEDIRTQRALVEHLQAMGLNCTQATVSRDVAEIGLKKLPSGTYILQEDLYLQHMVNQLVISARKVGNLVVVRATSGTAQGVAAALDHAEIPYVVGSVAGDDTIFVATECEADADLFVALIGRLRTDGTAI